MTPLPPGLAGGPVLPCLGAEKGWTGPRTCIKLWHGLTWRDARVAAASRVSDLVEFSGRRMILTVARSLHRYMPTGQPITANLDKLSILN